MRATTEDRRPKKIGLASDRRLRLGVGLGQIHVTEALVAEVVGPARAAVEDEPASSAKRLGVQMPVHVEHDLVRRLRSKPASRASPFRVHP